ncbi:MAG: rhomboid family intramembrane serine protease [Alphaproteobacteria bacterium CG_4_9_14_3_um_filter_47_13]|nr:MAG: rhomboid family intramembrane serine protease [Alphaproteobacteria bacterium CG_4_9_14_3_um_filter_47_13]
MTAENGKYNGDNKKSNDGDNNVIRMPTLAERDKARRDEEKKWRDSYRKNNPDAPFLNLPPVTKIMMAVLVIIHLALNFILDDPARQWVLDHFGFTPEYYTRAFSFWPAIAGSFTYALLHDGWIHISMNVVMMAAFGAGVEKWMGGRRMLVLFVLCSLGAALCHFILSPFSAHTMVGASGGISGLFAAVLVMMQMQGRLGHGRYGIWPLAAFWIGISFIFGLLGGPGGSAIAWAAHIGGFIAGLILIKPVLRMP